MKMYLPIMIVVLSNTIYHICAKSTPEAINPFASLAVTYAVSMTACILLYYLTQKNAHLFAEYHQLNWSSFALGLSVVGLEAGVLLMYRVGWNISTGQTVQSAILAVVLILVGYFLYKEVITVQKVSGVTICLVGLYLLNK